MGTKSEKAYEKYKQKYDKWTALREEVVAAKKEWEAELEADSAARLIGKDPDLLSEDDREALRKLAAIPSNGDGTARVSPVVQVSKGGD